MAVLKSEIRNKYSQIPNSVIRAKDVTDGDYRLLIYLYSLPNGWKINQTFLGEELNCNRRNINAKIKRLKDAGYLEIIKGIKKSEVDFIYILKEKDVLVNDTTAIENGLVNDASVNDTELPSDASVNDTELPSDASVNDTYINTNIINTDNIDNINNIYNALENNRGVIGGKEETFINQTQNSQSKEKDKTKFFKKPSIEELNQYCLENDLKVDVSYFYDYYESNGWTVGRNKMKDWKATLRNWNRRENKEFKTKQDLIREHNERVRKEWLEEHEGDGEND